VLVTVLLVLQPSVHLARADEPAPVMYVVGGVAGATLRAEPNGSSMALATVPAGGLVSQAGADVVLSGVVWRQVRTADGVVGYLPAGFLVALNGSTAESAAQAPRTTEAQPAPSAAQTRGDAPAGSVGAAPGGSVGAAPAGPVGAAPAGPVGAAPAGPVGAAPAVAVAEGPGAGQPVAESANAARPASSSYGSTSGPIDDGQGQPPSTRRPAPTPGASPTPGRTAPRTVTEQRRGQTVAISQIDEEIAPNGRRMGAGRIVVGFKPGASQPARAEAHRAAGSMVTESVGVPDVTVAEVSPGTVSQALATYRGRSDVAWAEPDYVHHVALTPNDPLFPSQYGPQKIGAPTAWDVTAGQASTKIAILDCGIFTESSTFKAPDGLTGHPDLRGKVIAEQNFSNATTGPDDWCGHGTLMAGIAAANTNSGAGVAGVAFNVKLLNGKVLNDNGDGFDSWVAGGIVWASMNGAQVISMSLGGDGTCSQTLQAAVDYAWSRGAVIVAAAGNGGSDGVGDPAPESPGNCTHVIPVAAIDQNDARASFSNYGPDVPLAAPGVNILSTNFIGTYGSVSGTSPATPHVAAVAALLWSTPFGTSNKAILDRMYQTADPIAGTGTLWSKGRVNAATAVAQVACSPRPQISVTTTADGSSLNVKVTVTGAGNTIHSIQVGLNTATSANALVTFPGTSTDSQNARSYLPSLVGNTMTFKIARAAANQTTTLPFTVIDGCGAWKTFAGGGGRAGF
jgi:thermitase